VALYRRQCVRAVERRRPEPAADTRQDHADEDVALPRHVRLAERPPVLRRERDARLRPAAQLPSVSRVRAPRVRRGTPLQDLQVRTVDRRPRLQRARLVPADRRPGEHRIPRVRLLLHLRVPAIPPPGPLRTLTVALAAGVSLAAALDPATLARFQRYEQAIAADPENFQLAAEYRQFAIAIAQFDRP